MSLTVLSQLSKANAARSLDAQTDPNQPLKLKVQDYNNPTTGAQEGHQQLVFLYNGTGGALTAGKVYMVSYSGDPTLTPQVIAVATATPARDVVVATDATATATWGWFVMVGPCQALLDGTTDVAVSDYLKVTNGLSNFVKDSATFSTASAAIACEARTADTVGLQKVILLGGAKIIA